MLIISIVCKISAYCSLFVRIFNKNQKLSDLFYMALSGSQRLLPLWYTLCDVVGFFTLEL